MLGPGPQLGAFWALGSKGERFLLSKGRKGGHRKNLTLGWRLRFKLTVGFLERWPCLGKRPSFPRISPPGEIWSKSSKAGGKRGLDPGLRPTRRSTIREGGGRRLEAVAADGE